ncbi:MAG: hypothetical protein U9Q75_03055 [Pseudomonadota bacterium]|nr:hypothetical protein [Pseudomonadota bacterium]
MEQPIPMPAASPAAGIYTPTIPAPNILIFRQKYKIHHEAHEEHEDIFVSS